MNWWGKVLGAACGLVIGGPLGALIGAGLGHLLDMAMGRLRIFPADRERIQRSFFATTFTVMGRVAKVDGRVSEDEIAFARSVMSHMALDESQRREAIRLFTEGKQPRFPLDRTLNQFRRTCHRSHNLVRMFLEIQLQAAYSDGELTSAERELLQHVFWRLGFSRKEFEHLNAMARVVSRFSSRATNAGERKTKQKAGGGERRTRPAAPDNDRVGEAFDVLGLNRAASESDIKKAYRRLMAQHHPDKLLAKGLPEEMVRLATEKTQEIKNAYEAVKAARGIR